MIIAELLDARREPAQVARIADQQHGCSALGGRRRRRRQLVVDLEVPVRSERNRIRIVYHEWSGVFTNERGENLEGHSTRRGSTTDGVAPGEHKASPVDLDVTVDRHPGIEIGYRPYLGSRL